MPRPRTRRQRAEGFAAGIGDQRVKPKVDHGEFFPVGIRNGRMAVRGILTRKIRSAARMTEFDGFAEFAVLEIHDARFAVDVGRPANSIARWHE